MEWARWPPISTTTDGLTFTSRATALQACSIATIMMEHFGRRLFRLDALSTKTVWLCQEWGWPSRTTTVTRGLTSLEQTSPSRSPLYTATTVTVLLKTLASRQD